MVQKYSPDRNQEELALESKARYRLLHGSEHKFYKKAFQSKIYKTKIMN